MRVLWQGKRLTVFIAIYHVTTHRQCNTVLHIRLSLLFPDRRIRSVFRGTLGFLVSFVEISLWDTSRYTIVRMVVIWMFTVSHIVRGIHVFVWYTRGSVLCKCRVFGRKYPNHLGSYVLNSWCLVLPFWPYRFVGSYRCLRFLVLLQFDCRIFPCLFPYILPLGLFLWLWS